MQDLLRKALNNSPHQISKESFSDWKQNPVTEDLFRDLLLAYIDQLEDDLPEDTDRAVAIAHQREGARKLLDILALWEPQSVKAIKAGDHSDD